MGELLDRYTAERPLLLVTEDLHWSDRETLQLMDHLARRRGNGRLMWLASFRLADVVGFDRPLNVLRHELRLHGFCEELVLDPFSEQDVADYVAQRAPSLAADERFVRALHERTDGLPSYVAQVLDDVLARGEAGREDVSAVSRLPSMRIPENLAGIIEHYVTRLSSHERAVLEAAAVSGVHFRIDMVAAMLGCAAASVASVCEHLARGRLWVRAPAEEGNPPREPTYSFRQAVFRQWLYERLGATQRAALHHKGSAAMEQQRMAGAPSTAAELAV